MPWERMKKGTMGEGSREFNVCACGQWGFFQKRWLLTLSWGEVLGDRRSFPLPCALGFQHPSESLDSHPFETEHSFLPSIHVLSHQCPGAPSHLLPFPPPASSPALWPVSSLLFLLVTVWLPNRSCIPGVFCGLPWSQAASFQSPHNQLTACDSYRITHDGQHTLFMPQPPSLPAPFLFCFQTVLIQRAPLLDPFLELACR